ncbi:MAG: OmpW/AlkL family protein [Asticcacaulis sp.]
MTSAIKTLTGLAAVVAIAVVGSASAQTATPDFVAEKAGQFVLTTRLTTVAPAEKGDILTAAGAATGLHVGVNNDTVPTLGFTYFLTDHVAFEAILGTSQHTISAVGATSTPVHKTWVLPPVVTVQYHFAPQSRFSPYVGAGINYMDWYSGKDENGFAVKLKSGAGTAVQAGADIALKGRWALNLDIKKVFYKTKANINGGTLKSDVKLDPAVISVGLAYRF